MYVCIIYVCMLYVYEYMCIICWSIYVHTPHHTIGGMYTANVFPEFARIWFLHSKSHSTVSLYTSHMCTLAGRHLKYTSVHQI